MVRVGDVFFERIPTIPNRDKKFFIIVAAVDPVRVVLINTVNAVQKLGRVELAATQVFARHAECDFLAYDSWIGCNELFGGYTTIELDAMVMAGRRRCQLTTELLIKILNAIHASPTVPEKQKARCAQAILAEIDRRP